MRNSAQQSQSFLFYVLRDLNSCISDVGLHTLKIILSEFCKYAHIL